MTANVWKDFLENKNMWAFHKPNFAHGEARASGANGLRLYQSKNKDGDLIGQAAVRGFSGKSLAYGENSQANPMHDALRFSQSLDRLMQNVDDHWGQTETNLIKETGTAILDFMKRNPPPVKTFSTTSEFCRICPAWAIEKYTDASARTYVAGEYNRWGSAPSLYCSEVVPHDMITLEQAMVETIGRTPTFSPPTAGSLKIPHHTLIEMVRSYRAHLGESYIFWGRAIGRSLLLLDMNFSGSSGNPYLERMENSPTVRRLLHDCNARGLIPGRNFYRLLVDKDDRKSILDLFGWGVAKGLIVGPGNRPLDGISFTGANTKREIGAIDSFQSHFVLFSTINSSLAHTLKLTRRVALRHDKQNDSWVLTETTPSESKWFHTKALEPKGLFESRDVDRSEPPLARSLGRTPE